MDLNKYQKIALAAGIILLVLIFGKTVTQVGLRAVGALVGLTGKFLIVIVAVLFVLSFLKKLGKKKR